MAHLKIKLVNVSVLVFFFFHLLSTTIADDAAYMSKLLKALTPTPIGWSDNTHFCEWRGVECPRPQGAVSVDDSDSYVVSINLTSESLTGTLPSDLNSLSKLSSLSLNNNSLSGPLPYLANLTSLDTVYLNDNDFTSIPNGCFQGLTSLKNLSLSNNVNLAPWTIPNDLSQSSDLVTLDLVATNIMGSLPDIFDSFPNLRNVYLSNNDITGVLPKSFARSEIVNLWLNDQFIGLDGTIDVLSSMTYLSQVWLHDNGFTGPIPDLSNCKNLVDLQLRNNLLIGVVPPSLMNLSSLKNISLDYNHLEGPMPVFGKGVSATAAWNMYCRDDAGPCDERVTTLLEIAAAFGYPIMLSNTWKGNNPCGDWNFIVCVGGKIRTVNLAKQELTGTISPAFANLTDLRNLYLNGNNLTGSIPASFTTLPHL